MTDIFLCTRAGVRIHCPRHRWDRSDTGADPSDHADSRCRTARGMGFFDVSRVIQRSASDSIPGSRRAGKEHRVPHIVTGLGLGAYHRDEAVGVEG